MITRKIAASILVYASVISLCIGISGCGRHSTGEHVTIPSTEVTVAHPLRLEIEEWDEYTGRFDAMETVEVRARVGGYVEEVLFTDGQTVNKGQTLFIIDQRPYKIALNEAQGSLARAEAELSQAASDFERVKSLGESRAISQEEFQQREQRMKATKASVRIARAVVDNAQLNLQFTEVKAPISGRVGRDLVNRGNLVSGGDENATLLTSIVSLNPIYFYFQASEADLLKYTRLDRSGKRIASRESPNPVWVKLQDEAGFVHLGYMDFVDNRIDTRTGTLEGRAVIENPDRVIIPGMFGRARLLASEKYVATLVPDHIIGTEQTQKYVYTVRNDSVSRTMITLGPLYTEELRIVRTGLEATDLLVLDNLLMIRPGSAVRTVQSEIPTAALTKN